MDMELISINMNVISMNMNMNTRDTPGGVGTLRRAQGA